MQACSIKNERIYFVANVDKALVTVFGEDLTGHCDGFSSNRPTKIKHSINYSILDQFTGDQVSNVCIKPYSNVGYIYTQISQLVCSYQLCTCICPYKININVIII